MIGARQKATLHIYKDAAQLSQPAYRAILRDYAGVPSAADSRMNQAGYERAMAALETLLFDRVSAGVIPDPIGRSKHISQRTYWRDRLPKHGMINSRQMHRITYLWGRLMEFLPPAQCSMDYRDGIVTKAIGRHAGELATISADEARHVIDAMADRLQRAITDSHLAPEVVEPDHADAAGDAWEPPESCDMPVYTKEGDLVPF